jgi:hypothetical protein
MSYTRRSAAVMRQVDRAIDAGLLAAAQVYRNRVMRDLLPGYTHGRYSHQFQGVAGSVAVAAPVAEGDARVVRVGTNVRYALHWELGWTPRPLTTIARLAGGQVAAPVYRKEVWRPALVEEADRMQATFASVFDRVVQAS